MKIRRGFVSNSSSSSFVVAFPKKPASVEEMRELLFKDVQSYPSPYDDFNYPATQIAEIVLQDMEEPLTDEEAIEEMIAGWWPYEKWALYEELSGLKNIDWKNPKDRTKYDEAWKRFDDMRRADAKVVIARWKGRYPNWQIFKFSYSDNDGAMSAALEHGGLFELLPHETISHH